MNWKISISQKKPLEWFRNLETIQWLPYLHSPELFSFIIKEEPTGLLKQVGKICCSLVNNFESLISSECILNSEIKLSFKRKYKIYPSEWVANLRVSWQSLLVNQNVPEAPLPAHHTQISVDFLTQEKSLKLQVFVSIEVPYIVYTCTKSNEQEETDTTTWQQCLFRNQKICP